MSNHRPTSDELWMTVADAIASRSRCGKGVGAVVVSSDNRSVGTGYNGPPAGWPVDGPCSQFCERMKTKHKDPGYTDCPSNHAEINALLYSDYSARQGGTLYITTAPCIICSKAIANSGISRVVWRKTETKPHRDPRESKRFLRVCGLTVKEI